MTAPTPPEADAESVTGYVDSIRSVPPALLDLALQAQPAHGGLNRIAMRAVLAAVLPAHARLLAAEIRHELVCCDVYNRSDPEITGEIDFGEHAACFWGESAARAVLTAPTMRLLRRAAERLPSRQECV